MDYAREKELREFKNRIKECMDNPTNEQLEIINRFFEKNRYKYFRFQKDDIIISTMGNNFMSIDNKLFLQGSECNNECCMTLIPVLHRCDEKLIDSLQIISGTEFFPRTIKFSFRR